MANETTKIEISVNPVMAILRRPLVQAFLSDPITVISGAFLTLIFLAALFAPVVAPHNPTDQQLPLRHVSPFSTAWRRQVGPTIMLLDPSCLLWLALPNEGFDATQARQSNSGYGLEAPFSLP